ncbi:hypothetical protein Desti_2668 [Desulfomonile tiedjei DSM 6799]|uniref:Uncharacterized protein n=1 Tax=Desulfomonile tiedjei (strain ATCC 49306 / DSM 6799 / DCB-1) TaxID=706587 RepID=I4C706_DESTA|nr:hypothetical protein Desti_2668 [Desulfomonile tiedjei DSM 6799]
MQIDSPERPRNMGRVPTEIAAINVREECWWRPPLGGHVGVCVSLVFASLLFRRTG